MPSNIKVGIQEGWNTKQNVIKYFKELQSIQAICTSSSKLYEVYISHEVKPGLDHNLCCSNPLLAEIEAQIHMPAWPDHLPVSLLKMPEWLVSSQPTKRQGDWFLTEWTQHHISLDQVFFLYTVFQCFLLRQWDKKRWEKLNK